MFRQAAIFYFRHKITYATSRYPISEINRVVAPPPTLTSFKFTLLFQRNVHSSLSLKQIVSKNSKGKLLPPSASINISESAVKQLIKIQSRAKNSNEALRVILESGGCHGFKIMFDLSDNLGEDDILIEKDGAKVVIDQAFLPLLAGSTVEYTQELIGSTFKIVDNPNAASGCGCGISFELK